jgi:hypothetical protein
MRKFFLPGIMLLALAGGAAWWFRAPLSGWLLGKNLVVSKSPQPDPATYAVLKQELDQWRRDLATRHAQARTEAARKEVEQDARVILELVLPAMMRCWLGTPWDFNGTAASPGAGSIACGYFVATVLKDAGFQVNRYDLAKQASENILRSFLPKESCHLTISKSYAQFSAEMKQAAPGIYLVGLDTHVAFVVVEGGEFRMIHASGSRPWCVVDEAREEAHVLQQSKWRMLGNLSENDGLIRTWLRAEPITVRGKLRS